MSRNPVRSRLIAWIQGLSLLLLAALGWKAVCRYGTGFQPARPAAAMFPFQAKALVGTGLGYPRGLEATVPAPAPGSNPEIQLRLMGLRDPAGWTMKALQVGRVEGRDLKVRAGRIAILAVTAVGPIEIKDGEERCTIAYRVRWELPDEDRELWGVKTLVDLRPPRGLDIAFPGQEAPRSATLIRRPWRWEVLADRSSGVREGGRGDRSRAWIAWLL